MNSPRSYTAAAVWNGKFVVCGGKNDQVLKSGECFDPENGVWIELNDLPTPLAGHCLVSYGNSLILMGGTGGKTEVNTVLELNNLEQKGTWKELPTMKCRRGCFSAAILHDEIFVIGGFHESAINKVEIYTGEKWRAGPSLPSENFHLSSVVIPQDFADTLYEYKQ